MPQIAHILDIEDFIENKANGTIEFANKLLRDESPRTLSSGIAITYSIYHNRDEDTFQKSEEPIVETTEPVKAPVPRMN